MGDYYMISHFPHSVNAAERFFEQFRSNEQANQPIFAKSASKIATAS